jgi:ABC-type transport system involved in multi-copper enzyme maturation permease subunit
MRRILAFELRYQLRSPLFLIGFAIFFFMTFVSVVSPYNNMGVPGNVNVNSPFAIVQKVSMMSIFGLFIVTAFVASVVIRDQDTGFAPILFATPVRKSAYLTGRFTGAMAVALVLLASVPLAIMLGSFMPWLDPQRVGPFVLVHYLYALFLVGLPVLLVLGGALFALATATRSMMGTYLGVVAFFVLSVTVTILLLDPAYDSITALIDPFGMGALFVATKYWTLAERNSLLPPLQGPLLANRLIWLAVASLLFAMAYRTFRFETSGASPHKESELAADTAAPPVHSRRVRAAGGGRAWYTFSALTRFEMRAVFRSPAFYVLLALGVFFTYIDLGPNVVSRNGVNYFPVTRAVIGELQDGFTIVAWIIAIYYSGELVWRERERRIHEIVDACPAPSWSILLPKVLAVGLVLFATLVAGVGMAMLFQLAHGYFHLEPLHYLLWFVVPETIFAWLLAVFAVCVQSLVPHKAIGWAVLMVCIALYLALPNFGFENGLYRYAYAPPVPLSDMYGMGRFWIGRAWFELYWSAFATLLVMLALLLWRRGTETRLAPRLALAWHDLRGAPLGVVAVAAAVWLSSGAFIYYNTNILNDYSQSTAFGQEHYLANYEKALLRYESMPQPKIVAVKLAVQLYPRQVRADTVGSYVIENRTSAPIAFLHVLWDRPLKMQALDVGPATLEKDYREFNYRIYRLATPIAPGEQRTLRFSTRLEERGFPNGEPLRRIVENGTFLDNYEIAPLLGMSRDFLLKDRSKRRRNGLAADLRPPKLEDESADAYNYIRGDSDFVDAEISITTDADQTPLAPGYTVSDKVKNGRRTLVTRSEAPIINFFSIQSARYVIARDLWTGKDGSKVNLAVYYHPGHDHNVPRILNAMKASLDVFSERFSPYQFRQARILEYPSPESLAQSFANTIAVAEGGFMQNFDDRESDRHIDLYTYGVAHELAHQWWGHQVVGADKQGDTMLSESFAQYSALLVMEKVYGREQIRKFLKYELDQYLRSRGTESVEELPLARVENQPYIHYNKGSVVMYWLKELVGEDAVDRALRRLLTAHAFNPAPYASTTDFLALLREEAPGHEQEIKDLFERITLYDMKARDATARKRADGRYEVRFTVEGKKFYADGAGKEMEVPLEEPFDVGAFTVEPATKGYKRDSVLSFERMTIKSGAQTLTLVLDKLPRFVGIDPFNERIDRDSDDNITSVKLE